MLKKIPLRLRLTLLSVLLLAICCAGLTAILNLSANRMADVIEAIPITPANEVEPGMIPAQWDPPVGTVSLTPVESSQSARTSFFYQSILYMVFVVAIGGGLTYYCSGKALKPLWVLSGQMRNCTVHNLTENLPVPESHDEIADLTRSFNEMSSKLDEAFAMQKRFSQSAAHELRTPLTVLKTKIDVFQKKKAHTPEEYDKLLSVISTHTNRLTDLVKALLDLTNLDTLACDQPIELKSMLTGIVEELSCFTAEKKITVLICGEAQTVLGNRSLLHRAFYNLVENAVKYNQEHGQLRISVAADGAQTTVTISDTGIGIPAELRDLVFEPFFRVDKSRSRQMGGSGLGLSTVKAVVEKHHGQISISENLPCGTVFRVTL